MHYEIRLDNCVGSLFTGSKNGKEFAENNITEEGSPTSIHIFYHHNQMVTSSFFYGILVWFQERFSIEGLGQYSFTRMVKLINTDDIITAELNRAIKRL